MSLGFGDYTSTALYITTDVGNNADRLGAHIGVQTPLNEGIQSTIYNMSSIDISKASPRGDGSLHYSQTGASTEFHYNYEGNSAFVDVYGGADASVNYRHNQDRKFGYEVGVHPTLAKDENGKTYAQLTYGPYFANQSGSRSNEHTTFDINANAGLAAGLAVGDEGKVYAFARGSQEVTNHRNLYTNVGVGYSNTFEILGSEVHAGVEVGYGKNWSGAATNNFALKQDGFGLRFGAAIDF